MGANDTCDVSFGLDPYLRSARDTGEPTESVQDLGGSGILALWRDGLGSFTIHGDACSPDVEDL